VLLYQSIGRGGAADVQLGRLVGPYDFSKLVAVKRLRSGGDDSELIPMLIDEARVGAFVHSPNVVSTLELIEQEGDLYVVMEYVHGESLSRLLRATLNAGALVPVPIALAIGCGLLHGLEAVHTAHDHSGRPLQVVHRDVSPQNLLVGLDGVSRLLDFGIAKAKGLLRQTGPGEVRGKLGYMSPEQIAGLPVDRRTDVYSAAVVLWETLVGDRLFSGQTELETAQHVHTGQVDSPSTRRPELPAALDEVLLRGLARELDQRWPSAREMAQAIEDHFPIASASQVGQWVHSLAANGLEERLTSLAAAKAPVGVLTPQQGHEAPAIVEPSSRSRPLARWLAALAGLGAVVSVAAYMGARPSGELSQARVNADAPTVVAPAPAVEVDAGVAPASPPPEKPAPRPAHRRRPDCRVPYFIDQQGHKRFRAECL
jgi:eukaryotic-like serine/threonine-protein kinase